VAKYTASVEKRFKSPGPQPNGLQAAEDGLWCIDQVNLKVHKMDWDSGEVLHEFDTETEHSSGITIGNGAVWITSTFELEVVKIDPEDGKTIARYPDPGVGLTAGRELVGGDTKKTGSHGIEWKDGKVYVAGPPTQRIHVMDAETWEEVGQFSTGGLRVHGIGWDESGRLWVSDTSSGTVMLMDAESGRIYDVFRVDEPDEVHGMTVRSNGEIWYCDAGTCDIGVLKR
jgi:streptogramin lyase